MMIIFFQKWHKEVSTVGREVILFKTEERRDARETASFLRSLAERLEQGRLTLKSGQEQIELNLPSRLTLETKVEEEEKKGKIKRSLEVEIEWIEGEDAADSGQVTIV